DLEVREILHSGLDHRLERVGLDRADVVIHALDLEAERGGEILLIADHDIDVLRYLAVDLLRLPPAAAGLPERPAVIHIVVADGAVLVRGVDGYDGEYGGRGRERGEDASGVKPAHAQLAKDVIPIDVTGFELRGRSVAAVRIADGPADAEAALGEVEAIAHG